MVYQSDFYTTRRPYTRPLSTSYTITPLQSPSYIPSYSTIQVRSYPHLPYVAHKRLVYVVHHTPLSTVYYTDTPIRIYTRLRPSVIRAELNRIRDRLRPSFVSYTNSYLNSKDCIDWDDEARDIRARADSLLRRIHVFVPRHLPSDYAEEIIPARFRSDDYIRRLLSGRNNQKKVLDGLSWYLTPEVRHIGDGNLACVKYVGGNPHSRRRPYYTVTELCAGNVKSDINLLSYYSKNRQAAATATPDEPMTARELRKARALAEDPPAKPKKVIEPEAEKEPEIIQETQAEEPEPIFEPEVEEKVQEKKKEKKEKKQKEKEKEKEVQKRLDEDALRRAEEYLARKAEEARLEEERQKKAEEERLRLEKEAEEARIALEKAEEERRLAEILEQERLEAIRKVEEAKAEAARLEAERIATEERRLLNLRRIYAEAIAATIAEEEDRLVQEKNLENIRRLEEEERLTNEVIQRAVDDNQLDGEYEDDVTKHHLLTDQEREEQPEVVATDEPKIEEEGEDAVEQFEEAPQEPIAETGGAEAAEPEDEMPVNMEDTPIVEEVTSADQEEVDIPRDAEDQESEEEA